MKNTSFPDEPRQPNKSDSLGVKPFEDGIVNFLNGASTPLTIALQGEWGSGKTSLMNVLEERLCKTEGSMFLSVDINTWEYGLMNDVLDTLRDIITEMANKIAAYAPISTRERLVKTAWKIGKVAVRIGANQLIDGCAEQLGEEFSLLGKSSVCEMRDQLQELVNKACEQQKKNGFIFFIDDLDRMNPPTAVELLELLKNIFTLDRCIFVLAIDYDVVIKGLKPKFGEMTDANEREFRSFFDKIIQVPFSMPLGSYNIDNFLLEQLTDIGYYHSTYEGHTLSVQLKTQLPLIARLTVQTNPRTIKRLLNTLSLITCINNERFPVNSSDNPLGTTNGLLLNFALVAVQVAYPTIYSLLQESPNFISWGVKEAIRRNLPEIEASKIERIKKMKEFDEEWEFFLYRFCSRNPFLKKRAQDISMLLNLLRDNIIENYKINNNEEPSDDRLIGTELSKFIKLSSLTSISNNQVDHSNFKSSEFLKKIRNMLIDGLKVEMPNLANTIVKSNSRVNLKASICINNDSNSISLTSKLNEITGKITLDIHSVCLAYQFGTYHKVDDFINQKLEAFSQDYDFKSNEFKKRNCAYKNYLLRDCAFSLTKKSDIFWNLGFSIEFTSEDEFYQSDFKRDLLEMAIFLYQSCCFLKELAK